MDIVHFIFRSACHQMPGRALEADGFAMPLCARCAGMYVGLFMGLGCFFISAVRRGLSRRTWLLAIAAAAGVLWLADGAANSFGWLSTPAPARFAVGMFLGLSVSPLVVRLYLEESGGVRTLPAGGSWPILGVFAAAGLVAFLNFHPARVFLLAESAVALAGFLLLLALIHAALLSAGLRGVRQAAAFSMAGVTVTAQIVLVSCVRGLVGV